MPAIDSVPSPEAISAVMSALARRRWMRASADERAEVGRRLAAARKTARTPGVKPRTPGAAQDLPERQA